MAFLREDTRLTVITTFNAGRAPNARRGGHNPSCPSLDYYHNPSSVMAPPPVVLKSFVPNDTPRVGGCATYRPLPCTKIPPYQAQQRPIAHPPVLCPGIPPHQAQQRPIAHPSVLCPGIPPHQAQQRPIARLPVLCPNIPPHQAQQQPIAHPPILCQAQQQPIRKNTEASTSHLSAPRSTVLLLGRSVFAEQDDSTDKGPLQRRSHIRRGRARASSECSMMTETVIEMPMSPEDFDEAETLTPLIENLLKLYTETPRQETVYAFRSPGTEETLDSPSVYSPYSDQETPRGDEPTINPFGDVGVTVMHDWDNGIHYRDATRYGIPEGRLLPKRVPTLHLKTLLRMRRAEAGLSIDVPATPDFPDS